jgi:Uncharacterized homolog of PSP1
LIFASWVKALVQEFRTRVEMRQIGVRHETQMTGWAWRLRSRTVLHRLSQ